MVKSIYFLFNLNDDQYQSRTDYCWTRLFTHKGDFGLYHSHQTRRYSVCFKFSMSLQRYIVIRYTQFAPLVVSYDNHGMYRGGVDSCVKVTIETHFVGRKRNSSGVTRRRLACRRWAARSGACPGRRSAGARRERAARAARSRASWRCCTWPSRAAACCSGSCARAAAWRPTASQYPDPHLYVLYLPVFLPHIL